MLNIAKVQKSIIEILEEFYPNGLSIKIISPVEAGKDVWRVKAEVYGNPSRRKGHDVILEIKRYEL